MLHIKFKSSSGVYDNVDFFVTKYNPSNNYRVGSCGNSVPFTEPEINADGIWTLTYLKTSLKLMFENKQVCKTIKSERTRC